MKIAIFPNPTKKQSLHLAQVIISFLKERNVEVVCEKETADQFEVESLEENHLHNIDFMISLGGDGTILRLLHRHPYLDLPLLGVNLGSLGFLADIPTQEVFSSLDAIVQGRYFIQKRLMMDGMNPCGTPSFAVNEVVIHRAKNPCLIDLMLTVDGEYLNTFCADGIIISTPSGSTAYSLAAGGPILAPELEAIVITPICPHTISNRPIVLMPKEEIRIRYMSEHEPIEITYDGYTSFMMKTEEECVIRKSSRSFKMVHLLNHNYFSTLRTKLGWTGKLKY